MMLVKELKINFYRGAVSVRCMGLSFVLSSELSNAALLVYYPGV